MTIIEGIGDEVLAVLIGALLLATLLLSFNGGVRHLSFHLNDLTTLMVDTLWAPLFGGLFSSDATLVDPPSSTVPVEETNNSSNETSPPPTESHHDGDPSDTSAHPGHSADPEFVRSQRLGFFQNDTSQSHINIRLKYLDDREHSISCNPSLSILDFKRQFFESELSSNQRVRLIYNGQLLQDGRTLNSYGITDGCVLHVQICQTVSPANAQQASATARRGTDPDLSALMWPLLAVLLVTLWLLRLRFKEYFDLTSTVILVTLTGVFISALVGTRYYQPALLQ